jgi:DNA polymerase-3 subunit beta
MTPLTLSRDPFLTAMQRVIGAVDRKTTIAVLQHVAFKFDGENIRLTATHLDMQATTMCPANGKPAEFTLPGQTVLDILSNWPAGGEVVISTDKDDPRISLKCGRYRFRLPTLKAGDMPVMDPPKSEAVRIDADQLASALGATLYAVSKDQTKFIMTGVFAHMQGEDIKFAATDNKRIATAWTSCEGSTGSAILAAPFVTEALRIVQTGDVAELSIDMSRAMLRVGETELIAKVIDGQYVEYARAFPAKRPNTLTVGREQLTAAVRRAQIVATDKDRSIRLHLSSDAVGVTARNTDSAEGDDEIAATWDGDVMAIGVNGAFLIDTLAHLNGDDVTIEVAGNQLPMVIQEDGRAVSVGVLRG